MLTEAQKSHLQHFVINSLSNFIDEEISSEYLVTDEMVNNDDWDTINALKREAIKFIIANL